MTSKFVRLAMSAAAASLLALPAFAQSAEWKVDSDHSSARIVAKSQSRDGDSSIALGAAAASGILRMSNSNPANSTFEFELYPSGAGSHLMFRSEKAALTADGKLKLSGTLTVSRVVREMRLEGNEGYSGPVETGRVVSQSSREESIIVPIPAAARGMRRGQQADVSASLTISDEDFPELVNEILAANWPAKAQDQSCEASAGSSEDYAGTLCTGSGVDSRSITRTATSFGEDYPGASVDSVQPGKIVTLALHLRLAQQGEQLSAKSGR